MPTLVAPDVDAPTEVEVGDAAEVDVEVAELTPFEGSVLRSARLAALRDSPECFTADLEEESGRDDGYWNMAVSDSTWFVARAGDRVVGLARVIFDPDDEGSRYIESVWVEGRYRRRGILRSLLEEIEGLARSSGVERLRLWVLDDNTRAQDAYVKLGFAFGMDEGDQQELATAPRRFELRMNKPL